MLQLLAKIFPSVQKILTLVDETQDVLVAGVSLAKAAEQLSAEHPDLAVKARAFINEVGDAKRAWKDLLG